MLEAHLAGGYLCSKLLTFEPKVVTKIHPGTKRSILRSGGSSSEALPGAVGSILGQKRLFLVLLKLLELCRLILEPWRITLEPWKLYLDHCDSSWRCRGSTWRHRASFRSRGGGTPKKRRVSKRQASKRLVSKRPVSKRQVYKTSGLQNVRFTKRQVSKRLVSKHPVSKRPEIKA